LAGLAVWQFLSVISSKQNALCEIDAALARIKMGTVTIFVFLSFQHAGRLPALLGSYLPQQCLYFLPLPQGHGSLRPTFGPLRTGLALACASTAWTASLTISLPAAVAVVAPPPPLWPPKALVD
jgi:hypothetical protein